MTDTHPRPSLPTDRLDRHDTYIGMQISVWLAGWGIFLLPIGTGVIGQLAPDTQKLLSMAMIVGTTFSLLGAAAGRAPIGRPELRITAPFRWVLMHVQKDYEPLPLRYCYYIGAGGLLSTNIALAAFSWQLLNYGSVIGSLTGLMTPILLITWTRKMVKLMRTARRMDRVFHQYTGDL